jgi:hypothetical protein
MPAVFLFCRPGSSPRAVQVRFLVDKVAAGQIFLYVLLVFPAWQCQESDCAHEIE